jgi:hypothetical protein
MPNSNETDPDTELLVAFGVACFILGDQDNHEPLAIKEQRVNATKNAWLLRLTELRAYEALYKEQHNAR